MSRRRIELAVLAFGAAFAAAVALSLLSGKGVRPSAAPPKRSASAASEGGQPTTILSGFDYTETVRGKPAFRIRAERAVGFGPAAGLAPERYALERVALTLHTENGAPLTVLADRADYDTRTKAALLRGNVRWSDEKGAIGETETVAYHPQTRLLEAPQKVHFSQGSFDVLASSGRYDVARRATLLSGPVRGSATGQGTGGLSSVAADAAAYRKDEQVIDLEGNVSASGRQGDRLQCDRLLVKTTPDGKRLEWARAMGGVRGRIASAVGLTPTAGAPATNLTARDYSGQLGVLLFGQDGEARSMSLTGHPATVVEAARRVSAETIDLDLEAGRPVAARAQGGVLFESPPNRAAAGRASIAYGPDGQMSSLELSGNVQLWGDQKSGTADQAVQVPSRGVWLLTGGAASSATVTSGGSKLSAPRIEIAEKRRDVAAEGGARAVFTPEKDRAAAATPLGDPARPTYGKASRIVLDDASHLATLSGAAFLWQDASSLSADDITLNDAERMLTATGSVRAVMPAPVSSQGPGKGDTAVVTARRLVYREAASTAVFDGGVVATRGSWRASAAAGTVFLDRQRKVEKVELAGDVSLLDAGAGRSGRADRAIDFPKEDRTILEGTPARATDSQGNRVAGATLTITQRGRRVEVTAPEGGKTEILHRTKRN
ncbi:MAG: LPS export ABC transporter periplasmic protein LptC [Thermoanaerobaculia bacterium]